MNNSSRGVLFRMVDAVRRRIAVGLLVTLTVVACGTGVASPGDTTTTTDLSATTSSTSSSTTAPSSTTSSSSTSTTTTVPAPAPTSAGRLEGRIIVIDPGHNGMNWAHPEEINRPVDIGTGTKACNTTGTSADGYPEAQFNWEVTQKVVPLLEEAGAKVILTRNDNDGWGPCIDRRAEIANQAGADAAISIHADGGRADGRGFHVIHPARIPGLTDDIYEESYRLAVALHNAYQSTGMPVADYIARGGFSERGDLGGLNLADVPTVFLEAGNMRNPDDLALLRSSLFQDKVARSILEALIDFMG